MDVLDVGFGDGGITMGVAEAVTPGRVTGMDPDEAWLEIAEQRLPFADNVSFLLGDSYDLAFPDDSFDLVFSHTVIHFFVDPMAGLKEQMRVVESGGWVIASGVREFLPSVRKPPCPNWGRTADALASHYHRIREDFESSGKTPAEYSKKQQETNPTAMIWFDPHAGSKCAGWFNDLGLRDIQISVKAEDVKHRHAERMEPNLADLLPKDEPEYPIDKQVVLFYDQMISQGLLEPETVRLAKAERDAWYQDPHAFYFNALVFAAGRVP